VRGYTAREAARVVGLSESQVRALVRDGVLEPARGERGELRFSFQDLVLLRTARGLLQAEVSARRVRVALRKLKGQLPAGRPIAGVAIAAEGNRIVVRDGGATWHPESGQALFDFGVAELAARAENVSQQSAEIAPLRRRAPSTPEPPSGIEAGHRAFEQGTDLETDGQSDAAIDAYRRAVKLHPGLPDAHVNLGRLLHERGEAGEAERHFRSALALRPDDATAAFNLGVALEDLHRPADALSAYEQALAHDKRFADAHFNAARVCEALGQHTAAIRHLSSYRSLTRRKPG
jgi:tetratricopeptide (TPR) repeat protein